ncbi:hypothetical protein HMPREF1985_02014 [Mitsuokella sp. oral taxon 131 str. W9106]|nr:hypothetical protein HMPREF1985_02014 [Mitsuokella sp. oral taxon 131 str. W9106]
MYRAGRGNPFFFSIGWYAIIKIESKRLRDWFHDGFIGLGRNDFEKASQ